ncbi:hypothetical protein [Lactobacillus sp.]|uniref:hypothetical protein n=1 Tax=Lactobacillus sp. TaxID=1591 RepID=UPI003EF1E0F4
MKKTATILASLSLALGLAAPLAPAVPALAATTQTTTKSATVGFKLYKTGTTDASSASRFLPSSATVSGDTLSLTVSKESAAMIKSVTINGVAGVSTTNSDGSITFAFDKAYKAGQGTVTFVVATPMGQMTNSADIVFDALPLTDGAYTASAQYLNASDTTKTSMAASYLAKNLNVTVAGGKVSSVKLTVSAAGAAVLSKVTMNGVAGTRTNNADKTATYTFAGDAYKEGKGEISFEVSAHAGSAVSAVLVLGSLTPAKAATDTTKKTTDTKKSTTKKTTKKKATKKSTSKKKSTKKAATKKKVAKKSTKKAAAKKKAAKKSTKKATTKKKVAKKSTKKAASKKKVAKKSTKKATTKKAAAKK